MKKLIFVLTCAFLTSCAPNTEKVVVKGEKGDSGTNGVDGKSCSVRSATEGAEIYCNDGTSVVVLNGTNGTSSTVTVTPVESGSGSSCPNGGQSIQVNNGSPKLLCNGTNGTNGVDASPISFRKLCSDQDEYAIRQGNDLYAVGFNSTVGGGLVKLVSGQSYYTTTNPSSACLFSVKSDGTTVSDSTRFDIKNLFTIYNIQNDITEIENSITILQEDIDEIEQQLQASVVKPVPLCGDEYALLVGPEVFAVWHKELSGNKSNTFWKKLDSNMSYITTDGNNCQFSISVESSSTTLTCATVTVKKNNTTSTVSNCQL